MSTSDDCQVPVKDGQTALPAQTAPEEMYWLRHMSREELLEKLVSLRDDFYTVKKFSCRQEDKIKKLQTKLRKLISDKKKDDKGGTSFSLKEMEYQEVLETQQLTIRDLRLKTQHLEKKLKLANIQLNSAKKNKPLMFRHVGPKVDSGLKQPRAPPVAPRPTPSPPPLKASPSSNESSGFNASASIHQTEQLMPERIREILEEARERIVALESERDDLQEQLTERQQAAENAEYEAQQRIASLEDKVTNLKEELHHQGVREERSSVAAVRAERESHTLSARTVALQEQLVATEEKVAAEKLRKDALHLELERMTEKLLGVENQLRGVQEEQQKAAGKLLEVTEKNKVYEKENHQFKSENERLTTLNLNFEQKGLARENERLKAQIAHLESALQSDLSERGSFLEHMTRDKENLARAEEEVKELKEKLASLQEELEKTKVKLNVYDKSGLLKLPDKDPTLLPPKVAAPSPKEFERLREAHSELQLLYREKSRELKQLSATVASHSSTYQALQSQVTKVTQESDEKERQLNMTVKSLEETIRRRNDCCDKLEAQILTLTNRGITENLEELSPCLTQTVSLGKHDNVLEFHIDRVVFELPEFSHLKTFVSWTVPFSLEDPLQHTNVARGTEAHYNYSALYKFQINRRNLMSLKEDTVTVSVYILLDSGHPAKVGECHLTFQEVLDHPRNTLHGTQPVVLAHDDAEEAQHLTFLADIIPGQVIGSMSYWFRLQRPSEGAIAQYLRTSGMLLATKREKLLPKQESKTKKTSTTSVKLKSAADETDENSAAVQISKKKDLHEEILPESEQEHLPVSSGERSSPAKRVECSEKLHESTIEHIPSDSASHSENILHGHEYIPTDPVTQQLTRSRSASVSSTGTYNVGSPKKSKTYSNSNTDAPKNLKSMKTKRVDSGGSSEDSSTRTYNVEDPKTSKVSGNSNSSTPSKIHRQKSPERADSKSSSGSHSSGRSSKPEVSSSSSHKKSSPSRVSHSGKGVKSEVPEERPNTSQMAALPLQPSPQMSDTDTKAQQLPVSHQDTSSSDGSRQEESKHQLSSSESNNSSDSEGVVAVVSKMSKSKDKHSRIYVEVTSMTLWPDCGILQDPMVELIFVDYHGFLGLPPDQLETPVSLPKNAPDNTLNFNFGQEFIVDKKQYPARVQALTELMGGRGILKFTITSEPSEEMQETHDCQDLGYAYVDLQHIARERQDMVEGELAVESAEDGSQIGVLKVTKMDQKG
ncbi:protein fantom-like isoform X3 [Scylla paramamosain]|uniref:protein fantom-like isoform X3 n=1 Tax=Scylla paramamosain TaxID=85552 RepID=UPI0030830FFA